MSNLSILQRLGLQIYNFGKTKPADPDAGFFGPSRQAGVIVNQSSAKTFSAYFACIKVISEDISTLGWNVFKVDRSGNKTRMPGNPIDIMLDLKANPDSTAYSVKEVVLAWALSWGNGYAEIVRNMAGVPVELWPIHPDRVQVDRDTKGQLVYDTSNASGPNTVLLPKDMFHLHGPSDDGLTGLSVAALAAKSIGLGLAAEQFGSSLFSNGAQLGGSFQTDNKLTKDAKDYLTESLKKYRGSKKAFQSIILEQGLKWQQIGIPPEEAQFLETRKFQKNEIASFFRVPPHKIGDLERATFSNIEQQEISYVKDALMPWIVRLEAEANTKFFPPEQWGRLTTKINANSIMRGDSKARTEYYNNMWKMGALNVNQILAFEGMNGIGPDGEKRFVQLNLTTLDRAGEQTKGGISFNSALAAHSTVLRDSIARILKREDRRISDAAKKHTDFADFEPYLDNFLNLQHSDYIKAALNPQIKAIAQLFNESASPFDIMESYLQFHSEISKAHYIKRFNNNWQPIGDNRAQANIDYLLDKLAIQVVE